MSNPTPTPSTYSPQAGSFAALVCIYFKANADETLTRSDIASKFDVASSSIDSRLGQCVATGLLAIKNDDDGRVWAAGPRLRNWAPGNQPVAASARGGPRVRLPALDAAKLRVVTGLPIPTAGLAPKGSTQYDAVFATLTEPGFAVVDIEARYANTLAKAAQTYCKHRPSIKLKVRRIPGTSTCGVWRLA